jgi:hypothetical protein
VLIQTESDTVAARSERQRTSCSLDDICRRFQPTATVTITLPAISRLLPQRTAGTPSLLGSVRGFDNFSLRAIFARTAGTPSLLCATIPLMRDGVPAVRTTIPFRRDGVPAVRTYQNGNQAVLHTRRQLGFLSQGSSSCASLALSFQEL